MPEDLSLPEFTLIEVDLDENTRQTISRLGKIFGLSQNLRLERKIIGIANAVVDDALKTARANSPVLTGELRDSFRIENASMATVNFSRIARVLVPDTEHKTSRSWRGMKPTNSWLADHLDTTTVHAGWIERGQAEFNSFVSTL